MKRNKVYKMYFLPRLVRCPVCGMKPFIIGSSPAYTIMGNDKCPLCKQVCSTETDIFKCYELWNRVVENLNKC